MLDQHEIALCRALGLRLANTAILLEGGRGQEAEGPAGIDVAGATRQGRCAVSACWLFRPGGLLCGYYLLIADLHGARPWVILLIELVPLLILAPGMLLGSARGHSWMCFVVNLYFIKGALAAYDPNRQWFGVLEMLASLAVFCTALLYVRWRYQLNRRLAD